jgi:hypothetical protein
MTFQVFWFLLMFFLLLTLMNLGPLSLPYHQPSRSKTGIIRTTAQRLLKPRTPLDCPACAPSSGVRPVPASVCP